MYKRQQKQLCQQLGGELFIDILEHGSQLSSIGLSTCQTGLSRRQASEFMEAINNLDLNTRCASLPSTFVMPNVVNIP